MIKKDVLLRFFDFQSGKKVERREEDVYDMKYRYRYFSIFPEDLNADYDPYNFIEEPVEPRSFRKMLTRLIGWTVAIPFVLFLLLYQNNSSSISSLFEERQSYLTQLIQSDLESTFQAYETLFQASQATPNKDASPEVQVADLYLSISQQLPIAQVAVVDSLERSVITYPVLPVEASAMKDLIPLDVSRNQLKSIRFWLPRTVIATVVEKTIKASGAHAYLLDENQRLMYSSNGQTLATHGDLTLILDALAKPEAGVWLSSLIQYGGTSRSATKLSFPEWYLIIDQSETILTKDLQQNAILGSVLFFFALCSAFVVGFFVSRPLSQSIAGLSDAVETFARTGQMPEVRMTGQAPTEIQDLAKRFVKMAHDVQASQARLKSMNQILEERVAQRTDALASRNAELATIQRLLTPIASSLTLVIDETIARFKKVLNLNVLNYLDAKTLSHDEKIAKQLSSDMTYIRVHHGDQLFGWLEVSVEELKLRDVRDSLDLLANSIATVLSNQHLLKSSVEQHQLLSELFSSMNEGVVLLDSSRRFIRCNQYFTDLLASFNVSMAQGDSVFSYLRQTFDVKRKDDSGIYEVEEQNGFEIGNTYVMVQELTGEEETSRRKTFVVSAFNVLTSSTESDAPAQGLLIRDISDEAEVERVKDQLISIVAHELKTPITALRLQAETLATTIGLSNEERDEILRDMQEESFRLRKLVDDWLDVTRFRDGLIELSPRVMHIATPIDKATRLVKARFELQVTRTIEPDAECFRFDPERITQVFINLFSNAARYLKEGTYPQVHVHVKKIDDFVEISVTDNGVGIPKEKLPYVFERFYQADMSIARRRGGTGLGLTIVKGIVNAHHGTIKVESQIGEGTRFIMRLPY